MNGFHRSTDMLISVRPQTSSLCHELQLFRWVKVVTATNEREASEDQEAAALIRGKYEKQPQCVATIPFRQDWDPKALCLTSDVNAVWVIVCAHTPLCYILRLSLACKEEIMMRLVWRAAENTEEKICTAVPVSHTHAKHPRATQIQSRQADPFLSQPRSCQQTNSWKASGVLDLTAE